MSILSLKCVLNQRLFYQNNTAQCSMLLVKCSRTLFSEKILRINEYETHRMRLPHNQFNIKRLEFSLNTNNLDTLIRDTKQWIHAMDKIHCQMAFPLLQRCLRHIHRNDQKQQAEIFGPLVMRMMHFFNIPENALQLNFDPQLRGMFHKLSCTMILCDMLFNNGKYQDVVHVIQRRRDDLLKREMSTNRNQNCLLFAACYKLNTSKDFQYALEVWESCNKEHQLTQSINFLAMLAINQGQPQKALEILPSIDKHLSSTNVRLVAHCECAQYAEAIEIIENQYKYHKISNDAINRIQENIGKSDSADLKTRLNTVVDEIVRANRINYRTMDEILCWPISHKLQDYDSKSKIKPKIQLKK